MARLGRHLHTSSGGLCRHTRLSLDATDYGKPCSRRASLPSVGTVITLGLISRRSRS